jgi:hypothetical protein
MKRRLVPGREARAAETGHRSGLPRMTNDLSAPHGVRILGRITFRMLRETFAAIALVTDPEKADETLGLLKNEPGK